MHDRFTGIKLVLQRHTTLAISLYLPTTGKDEEYLACLDELSLYIRDNSSGNDTVLIGADSNCSGKSSPRRVQALHKFCTDHSLLVVRSPGPTFHHHNGVSTSNIDYFLISRSLNVKIRNITIQCTQDYPQNLSSHDPVLCTLMTPNTVQAPLQDLYTHTYTEFKNSCLVWKDDCLPQYQALAGQLLLKCEEYFPDPEFIPLKCQLYSDLLVRASEISLETKHHSSVKKHKFPPKLHQAWQRLQKAYNIWKKSGKCRERGNQDFLNITRARAAFQQVRRHCDNLKTIRNNNILMHTHKSDRTKHLKLVKKFRGCNSQQKLSALHTPAGDYFGNDILEGFARDAEILGEFVGETPDFDNHFYRLCVQDNIFIFEFKEDNNVKIPKMTMADLNNIVNKEMKRGKACDIYKLTAEHLKNAGTEAKTAILNLINDIIENIEYLACPQIKTGLSTAAFKGKRKPVSKSSSYRRITVTPQLGSILDRFVDPISEEIFQSVQSTDQYGFTRNISYLMGAVLRGECQRHAMDTKQTCFGVSFDGQAAFPSVDRSIQLRELYSCGESGDILQYSRNIYTNTTSRIKREGKLSREFREHKGSRQGHKKSSGHFKSYINPCLLTADSSKLGYYIGPVCVSIICIADDTYVMSGTPRGLQGLIDIVGHYGRRYRLIFGPDKTKVTVTGSKHDMQYYRENNIWSLYGEQLEVAEDNDHLGLVVSGCNEELKNIDKNIHSARKSLFNFLGNIFAYK